MISTVAAGPAVPSANAAWAQPANIQTNKCPGGVQPSLFIPDQSGNLHTVAGVDENSNNSHTSGTLEFCHSVWFNDTLITPPQGNNAFVDIAHIFGIDTSSSNQDRTLWLTGNSPTGDSASRYALEVLQAELDFNCVGWFDHGIARWRSHDGKFSAVDRGRVDELDDQRVRNECDHGSHVPQWRRLRFRGC